MKGKLIVIEGVDCSGKEVQSNYLYIKLNKLGIKTEKFSFPMYDSPTGKIVGGPYLSKDYIGKGFFKEGASNVDPKVASLYFIADRQYNIKKITNCLDNGINVIVDRYVESNMAHQGGKIENKKEKEDFINWLEELEYSFMKFPRPDLTIFLHMPIKLVLKLKEQRQEKQDEHEKDIKHLENAEETYKFLAQKYGYFIVNCQDNNGNLKSISKIGDEVYKIFLEKINKD